MCKPWVRKGPFFPFSVTICIFLSLKPNNINKESTENNLGCRQLRRASLPSQKRRKSQLTCKTTTAAEPIRWLRSQGTQVIWKTMEDDDSIPRPRRDATHQPGRKTGLQQKQGEDMSYDVNALLTDTRGLR